MLDGASNKLVIRVQYCGGCVGVLVLIESLGRETSPTDTVACPPPPLSDNTD